MSEIEDALDKIIKLLEAIKANQPIRCYSPIHCSPVLYYPAYPPLYPPYQPYTSGGTVNTDKDNPTGNERPFPV